MLKHLNSTKEHVELHCVHRCLQLCLRWSELFSNSNYCISSIQLITSELYSITITSCDHCYSYQSGGHLTCFFCFFLSLKSYCRVRLVRLVQLVQLVPLAFPWVPIADMENLVLMMIMVVLQHKAHNSLNEENIAAEHPPMIFLCYKVFCHAFIVVGYAA